MGTTNNPFIISTFQLFLWNKKYLSHKIVALQNIKDGAKMRSHYKPQP